MFALFNKNKKFIGYSEDIPDLPTMEIFKLPLPEDKKDISKWEWVGDMFDGKMVKRNNCNF
jgi:hypothetical protein